MLKEALCFLLILFALAIFAQNHTTMKTFFDFKANTIEGTDFDFSGLKGKKVLVVNTASMCGNTPQYKELEELYKKYGGSNFTIIGFPSNDFGAQEPGTNSDIKEFCTKNYGVTFPMMSKITVKGDQINPIYKWLTRKEENGVQDAEVKWNFQKYMIDEQGHWAGVISDEENPICERIINWLEN